VATPRPTVKPNPTHPPVPGPVRTASLGGTEDAFTTTYGDPTTYGGAPNYAVTLADGTAVAVALDDIQTGTDGQPRVDQMSVNPADPSAWSDAVAAAVTSRFVPRDAHFVRDIADPNVGTIHVYQSADLARSFPASAFTDSGNNGARLPAGTLGVACDNSAQTGCTITIGT
jgi:hypothetical protein